MVTYIYHKNQVNVGKYTSFGLTCCLLEFSILDRVDQQDGPPKKKPVKWSELGPPISRVK